MTTFESTIKQVQASQKAVYAKLSDLNNLAKVKDRLPEHKVKNMTFDTDTLSMQAPPIGTITLKIVAREPESCITFGTKPLSMAVRMAVQYAYRVKRNTSISCIVYGQIDRPSRDPSTWRAYVYDETALVRLDEIVRVLADRGVADPGAVISSVLAL